MQGLILRKKWISSMENDGFALIFPHSVVENAHTAPKAFSLPWVGGGRDLESGDFVAEQVDFVDHPELFGEAVTNTIYGKRSRGPIRKHGRGLPKQNNTWGCVCISRVVWVYGRRGKSRIGPRVNGRGTRRWHVL